MADIIASSSRASHALAANQMRGVIPQRSTPCAKNCCTSPRCWNSNSTSRKGVESRRPHQLRDTRKLESRERIDALRSSFSLGNAIKESRYRSHRRSAKRPEKAPCSTACSNEERAMVSSPARRATSSKSAPTSTGSFSGSSARRHPPLNDTLEQMGIARTAVEASNGRRSSIPPDRRIAARHAVSGGSLHRRQMGRKSPPAVRAPIRLPALKPGLSAPSRPKKTLLTVYNKIDKAPGYRTSRKAPSAISARNGDGIDDLRRILRDAVDTEKTLYHGWLWSSPTARHYEGPRRHPSPRCRPRQPARQPSKPICWAKRSVRSSAI